MKTFLSLLLLLPFLALSQLDSLDFANIEKSKLIEVKDYDWGKVESYENGWIIYNNEYGGRLDQIETIKEICLDSVCYSRHESKKGIYHTKVDYHTSAKNHNQVLHGDYISYHGHNKNKPEVVCRYINDTLDGDYLIYESKYGTLFLEFKVNFKNGIPNGVYEQYNSHGLLRIKGEFKKGEKIGVWIINDITNIQPPGSEWYPGCKGCYTSIKSEYREFFPDGVIDSEININNPRIRLAINLPIYVKDDYFMPSDLNDEQKKEILEINNKKEEERKINYNKKLATFNKSILIKTEYFEKGILVSCEGLCD